jgi:integrase
MQAKHKHDPRRSNGDITKPERRKGFEGIWLHFWKFQCKLWDPNVFDEKKQKWGKQITVTVPDEFQGGWREAHRWFKSQSGRKPGDRLLSSSESVWDYGLRAIGTPEEPGRLADLSPSTRKSYMKWFKRLTKIHRTPISKLSTGLIRSEVLEVAKEHRKTNGRPLAGSTIKNRLTVLSNICDLAVSEKLLDANPVSGLSRKERPSAETDKEHKKLSEKMTELILAHASPKYRNTFAVMMLLGLRLGETLGLRIGDINYEQGWVEIHQQKNEKGVITSRLKSKASRRNVPLSKVAMQYLKEQERLALASLEVVPINTESVLLFGEGYEHQLVQGALARLVKKLDLLTEEPPEVVCTPHTFRHNWVCQQIWWAAQHPELQMDFVYIARIAGHTVATLMEHYAGEIGLARQQLGAATAMDEIHAGLAR